MCTPFSPLPQPSPLLALFPGCLLLLISPWNFLSIEKLLWGVWVRVVF